MLTIWKYPIRDVDIASAIFELDMPKGAKVLTVQMQGNSPVMWALVNPETKKVKRMFLVKGTGHPIEDRATCLAISQPDTYIGTFQLAGGALIFHVFNI